MQCLSSNTSLDCIQYLHPLTAGKFSLTHGNFPGGRAKMDDKIKIWAVKGRTMHMSKGHQRHKLSLHSSLLFHFTHSCLPKIFTWRRKHFKNKLRKKFQYILPSERTKNKIGLTQCLIQFLTFGRAKACTEKVFKNKIIYWLTSGCTLNFRTRIVPEVVIIIYHVDCNKSWYYRLLYIQELIIYLER